MSTTLEHFKNELNRETYRLYVNLSPGTRIKAQLDYPQFLEHSQSENTRDDITAKDKSVLSSKPNKEEQAITKPSRVGSCDKSQVQVPNKEMACNIRYVRKKERRISNAMETTRNRTFPTFS
jgi:hypothetical protein